jgi:hypothetical protein
LQNELLNAQAIADLQTLRQQNGLDVCGEKGKHPLATNTPDFRHCLHFRQTHLREQADLAHLEIEKPELQPKSR